MPPVSYEVTVALGHPADAGRFRAWMEERHIAQVLATGCFSAAELAEREPGVFRTRYVAASAAELERYLAEHAPGLRLDFAREFGERATVSREIWSLLHHSQFDAGT